MFGSVLHKYHLLHLDNTIFCPALSIHHVSFCEVFESDRRHEQSSVNESFPNPLKHQKLIGLYKNCVRYYRQLGDLNEWNEKRKQDSFSRPLRRLPKR